MTHVTVRCTCGTGARIEVPDNLLPPIDRRAVAMKVLSEKGWIYHNGRMGKTTVTMTCFDCRIKNEPLVIEGDFDPRDVTQTEGTDE